MNKVNLLRTLHGKWKLVNKGRQVCADEQSKIAADTAWEVEACQQGKQSTELGILQDIVCEQRAGCMHDGMLCTSSLMSLVLLRISGKLHRAADSECSTALRTS